MTLKTGTVVKLARYRRQGEEFVPDIQTQGTLIGDVEIDAPLRVMADDPEIGFLRTSPVILIDSRTADSALVRTRNSEYHLGLVELPSGQKPSNRNGGLE